VGLTTAATIFVEAAIGMAAGGGLYKVAGISGVLVLGALVAMIPVENRLNIKRRYMQFKIVAEDHVNVLPDVRKVFEGLAVKIEGLVVTAQENGQVITFDADVSHHQQDKALLALIRPGVTCEMKPSERQYE
jgi:putative Mg2+ transporter-C (MgtC) family protein